MIRLCGGKFPLQLAKLARLLYVAPAGERLQIPSIHTVTALCCSPASEITDTEYTQ